MITGLPVFLAPSSSDFHALAPRRCSTEAAAANEGAHLAAHTADLDMPLCSAPPPQRLCNPGWEGEKPAPSIPAGIPAPHRAAPAPRSSLLPAAAPLPVTIPGQGGSPCQERGPGQRRQRWNIPARPASPPRFRLLLFKARFPRDEAANLARGRSLWVRAEEGCKWDSLL